MIIWTILFLSMIATSILITLKVQAQAARKLSKILLFSALGLFVVFLGLNLH